LPPPAIAHHARHANARQSCYNLWAPADGGRGRGTTGQGAWIGVGPPAFDEAAVEIGADAHVIVVTLRYRSLV